MVSAGSTRESCLIWIATIALSTAADSATSVPTLKDVLPGCTITSTPMKPMITALQRRMRTFSCRKITAAMVTNSGAEYASEIACAIGRLPIAQKPHSIERSEEHTSELQSLMRISYAVFCLKKKKQQ